MQKYNYFFDTQKKVALRQRFLTQMANWGLLFHPIPTPKRLKPRSH
jgi:hypothetical protein